MLPLPAILQLYLLKANFVLPGTSYSPFIKNLQDIFEETEQASEAESDIAEMVGLSDQKSLKTMINMLRDLMEKVDNIQEQMDNISTEMDILRKNKKEMLEIKSSLTEMKNAFYGLISRLNMAKERIPELDDMKT